MENAETAVAEKPKRSALELYGGKEAVLERMIEAVREGLSELP